MKGKGYNEKGPDGLLKDIIGTVVGITPGSDACNIQVAHVVTTPIDYEDCLRLCKLHGVVERRGVLGCGSDGGKSGTKQIAAVVDLEYGQCDHFERVA